MPAPAVAASVRDSPIARAERILDAFFVIVLVFQIFVLIMLWMQESLPRPRLIAEMVLLVVITVLWVMVRRRPDARPPPVVLLTGAGLAYVALGDSAWPIPLILLILVVLAVDRGMRAAYWFCAITVVVITVEMVVIYRQPLSFVVIQIAVLLGIYAGVLVIVSLTRRMEQSMRHNVTLLQELEVAHAELADSVERQKDLAVAQWRTESARDLHDGLGHRLAIGGYSLEFALRMRDRDPEQAWVQVEAAQRTLSDAMRELRSYVRATSSSDQIDTADPLGGIRQAFAGSDLPVIVEAGPLAEQVDHRVAETLHRVAQEGITNAIKHADGAPVRVSLTSRPGQVVVQVADEGPGVGQETAVVEGFGMRHLRERVAHCGGALMAGDRAGGGFELQAVLPPTCGDPTPGRSPDADGHPETTGDAETLRRRQEAI